MSEEVESSPEAKVACKLTDVLMPVLVSAINHADLGWLLNRFKGSIISKVQEMTAADKIVETIDSDPVLKQQVHDALTLSLESTLTEIFSQGYESASFIAVPRLGDQLASNEKWVCTKIEETFSDNSESTLEETPKEENKSETNINKPIEGEKTNE